jgi:1-deoxy-D-xylulose-5-phosphate reductoisomerase
LTYPERLPSPAASLDWSAVSRLDFSLPDRQKFPCLGLAYRAMQMGGTAPAVVNAADEVLVAAFLERKIAFSAISQIIAATLDAHEVQAAESIEAIMSADAWARRDAQCRFS